MAKDIQDMIVFLEGFVPLVKESAEFAIEENEENIADMNRNQLQQSGIDADGQSLGTYTPFTKRERAAKGLQTEFVDLRFTGKLQNSLNVKKKSELKYELLPTDSKWNDTDLRDRYPEAFGLIDDNEDRLTTIIIRDIEHRLNTAL